TKDKTQLDNRGLSEVAIGNLDDALSLRAAADGVNSVFISTLLSAPNEAELGVAMVEAAKASGVRKMCSLVSITRQSRS
ncbi:hypothetical protein FM036_40460, partial [Nostoc sp. HG1]|nr:hypothetical protein [Nostoc sp. HG1]